MTRSMNSNSNLFRRATPKTLLFSNKVFTFRHSIRRDECGTVGTITSRTDDGTSCSVVNLVAAEGQGDGLLTAPGDEEKSSRRHDLEFQRAGTKPCRVPAPSGFQQSPQQEPVVLFRIPRKDQHDFPSLRRWPSYSSSHSAAKCCCGRIELQLKADLAPINMLIQIQAPSFHDLHRLFGHLPGLLQQTSSSAASAVMCLRFSSRRMSSLLEKFE